MIIPQNELEPDTERLAAAIEAYVESLDGWVVLAEFTSASAQSFTDSTVRVPFVTFGSVGVLDALGSNESFSNQVELEGHFLKGVRAYLDGQGRGGVLLWRKRPEIEFERGLFCALARLAYYVPPSINGLKESRIEKRQMVRVTNSGAMKRGPSLTLQATSIDIDRDRFLPITIIEAARQWAEAARENGWPLLDLNGCEINATELKVEL